MLRRKIISVRCVRHSPPGLSQIVGHKTEIDGRRVSRSAPDGIPEYLPGPVGHDIQNDHGLRKIEGCVFRIQGLQQSVLQVEFLPQILSAFHRTIPSFADRVCFSAGQTSMMMVNFRSVCQHFISARHPAVENTGCLLRRYFLAAARYPLARALFTCKTPLFISFIG